MSEQDIDLYDRVQQQDKEALSQLYERYEKLLFSFAYRITKRRELSEEIVQEVFIKIWTKPGIYDRSKGKFSSWLLTVTRNTGIDQLRKKNENTYEIEDRDALQRDESSVEEQVEWKEDGRQLRKAMSYLADEQQEIVELFYFKGLSQQKISEKIKIPLGTVKGRLRLALKHLRKNLETAEQGRDI